MRKTFSTVLVVALSLMLLGCPGDEGGGGTDGEATADGASDSASSTDGDDGGDTAKVDISHVKKGQRYHYHMVNAPGSEIDMIWEILEVSESEIKYASTVLTNGNPVGDPQEQVWTAPAPSEIKDDPNTTPPAEETITAAGKEWECWVIESAGIKTWAPKKNGLPSFPSYVKQMKGDTVTNLLTKIED